MPNVPVTGHRTDDSLELRRGNHVLHVFDLTQLVEVLLVRVGEGFSGPNEFILILVEPHSATPLPLEHHSVWTSLLAEMRHLASQGAAFQADAARLPRAWLANRLSLFTNAHVVPVARPRGELDAARREWSIQPLTEIPQTMP
jgi:hypothetical protein